MYEATVFQDTGHWAVRSDDPQPCRTNEGSPSFWLKRVLGYTQEGGVQAKFRGLSKWGRKLESKDTKADGDHRAKHQRRENYTDNTDKHCS
jgi:hypothetical protein